MTDVGVVGAEIVGLATAFAVRERGDSVTVYERGVPGNASPAALPEDLSAAAHLGSGPRRGAPKR